MAYNDKRLKTDLEGKPIPQAYNPDIDDYEPVHSTNNALKQVIYGPNGQPISTVGNKLAVKATELEALMQGLATEGKLEQVRQLLSGVATENKLEQARVLLNTISTKDFATQTTLAAVLAKLGQLETEIQAVKANQLSGDQKVQLSGTMVVELANWEAAATPARFEGATTYLGQSGLFRYYDLATNAIDIGGYRNVRLEIHNNTNYPMSIRNYGYGLTVSMLNSGRLDRMKDLVSSKTFTDIEIPTGAQITIDATDFPELSKGYKWLAVGLGIATIANLEGSVVYKVWGIV